MLILTTALLCTRHVGIYVVIAFSNRATPCLCTFFEKRVILQRFNLLYLFKETILQGGILLSFALSSSDRELHYRTCIFYERAKPDILHACTCLRAILSVFTMLYTNPEWAVIAPGASFFVFRKEWLVF